MPAALPSADQVIAATRAWVEHAVIGLNLCPFAKGVQTKGQVRYVASSARDADALLVQLCQEMQRLVAAPPQRIDTTLLIHPGVLAEFDAFNDFLDIADAALHSLGHAGVLQIASFHPHYRFAGTRHDDLSNATNRSPYPTLHLLREASVDRAVAAFPHPEAIYETNLRTIEDLGAQGWAALQANWTPR